EQTARVIASWQENNRILRNRRLEATVVGKLGWALINVKDFERALEAFERMSKRLRGEHDDPIGKKAGDSRISRAKNKTKVQQSKEEPTTREDLLLLW
ncbi:unnamed protein product, partial [Ectocarpus sp. 8 AP-2014]